MNSPDGSAPTVALLLTPPGTGAVAVIGLRGPGAMGILNEVFRPMRGGTSPPDENRIVFGKLHDAAGPVDDGLVVVSRRGSAWHVEINTHGSWRVLQRLMRRLGELGARVVSEGPAAQTGEAELGALTAVDSASSAACISVDGDALEGDLWSTLARCQTREAVRFVSNAVAGLRGWLKNLEHRIVIGEACLERADLEALLAEYEANRVLIDGARLALVGPPNVGKSTLANRLYARQASLESEAPGTTRDWVEEAATFGGVPILAVDTAGLREAGEALEDEAIRRGLLRSEQADFRWFMMEPGCALPVVARYWLEEQAGDERTLLLVNKIDVADPAEAVSSIPESWRGRELPMSARTGEGLERVEAEFRERLGLGPIRPGRPGLICQRQAESVRFALARYGNSEAAQVASRLVADLRDSTGIE